MRPAAAALLVLVLPWASGCESRGRTRNSAGAVSADHGEIQSTAHVYRFVGVERALADARKAAAEERWDEALAAARSLLEKDPGHAEAKKLAGEAEIEARSHPHYRAFRAALERSGTTAGAAYQKIDPASRYRAEGLLDYERVREQWALQREDDARALASAGRCREAHRVARQASDSFPEVRARLDAIAVNCRARSVRDEPEPEPAPAPAASPPVASLDPVPAPAPVPVPAPTPTPEPPSPPATASPTTPVTTAATTPPAVVPAPAPAPATPSTPKLVPAVELEKNRTAGERRPPLPAGARRLATRDRVDRFSIGVRLCLSDSGAPTEVTLLKPSVYDDANAKVLADVRAWRFKPYLVNGKPAAVCTGLLFIYQLE
jgi:protein TonB